MITLRQYFGYKPHPIEHDANAKQLLAQVNLCLYMAEAEDCYDGWIDPDTGSQISGAKGGSGDGGYRAEDSTTGSKSSAHREAQAVDVYDPDRKLAQWCLANKTALNHLGLYCEDFRWTPTWVHFQTRETRSGKIVFIPYSDLKKHPPLAPALDRQKPIPFRVKTI